MDEVGGGDELDLMIDEVRSRRTDDVPLYITVTEVLYEFMDELDDSTLVGLEAAGYKAVASEGEPPGVSVPGVRQLIEQGRPYAPGIVSDDEAGKLHFVGFLAIVAETLMREDSAGN